MGWYKNRTIGKTLTQAISELVEKHGKAVLLGKNETVVDNYKEYKVTKRNNYIIYERR